jgi:hypothetical protein
MATLSELDRRGDLHRLDPALPGGVLEERMVYLSDRMRLWIENTLPGLGSTWNIEVEPIEQLDQFTAAFCEGRELTYERQFNPLHHKRDGIWELKTADLRIFGWFAHKDHFVAVCADTAERVKEHDLYHGYCGEVERFRDAIDLDHPKYVAGTDPHAVVSNYSFP